jgi:hypothetical protein
LNKRGFEISVVETGPMGKKNAVLSREKVAPTREVLAFIGRRLREQYEAPQPLSERLAELVSKIEQSANE